MEANNKLREALIRVKKNIDAIGKCALTGKVEPEALTIACAGMSGRIEAALVLTAPASCAAPLPARNESEDHQ